MIVDTFLMCLSIRFHYTVQMCTRLQYEFVRVGNVLHGTRVGYYAPLPYCTDCFYSTIIVRDTLSEVTWVGKTYLFFIKNVGQLYLIYLEYDRNVNETCVQ